MSGRFLLDSSFVIDLLNEVASGVAGPACDWLGDHPRARLWISPVTLAEVMEGAEEPAAARIHLARYAWQGIHRAQAEKAALRQRRAKDRLGENDAWQAAVAESIDAVLLGHDRDFKRLGPAYHDYRARH